MTENAQSAVDEDGASEASRMQSAAMPLFAAPCPVVYCPIENKRASSPPASVHSGFTDILKLNVRRACLNQAVDLAD